MRFPTLAVLLVALLVLPALGAFGGEKEDKALRVHIEVLVHEARAMKEAGRHDAADILLKRAHELTAQLEGRDEERAQEGTPLSMDQAEKVLHGLEMGMEALKTLHREKELKAVARVADGLRRKMHGARGEPDGDKSEREVAEHRLEILRMAFTALREGEKREAMERMEHVIHALELGLEGRRDEEAQEIRRTAPKVGEQIELLRLAARLWDEFGHEGKVKIVNGLAEEMAGQHRARAERAQAGKTDRRPEASAHGEARAHLESMHKRLRQIQEMVEALHKQLAEFEREMSR